MQTTTAHDITITEVDFDRLNHLVESARYRMTHPHFLTLLKDELTRGRVVPCDKVAKNIVTMNSQVRIRDMKSDETETYTLVYPEDADIDAGKLSVLAPLGIALLGAKVGKVVRFEAPAGLRRLKVEEILYQPEAAGDLYL